MTRIALGIEYDGHDFAGWQAQPSVRTVQQVLETALANFLNSTVRVPVTAAGRTDAGVHANGQVVHLDTDVVRTDHAWVRGLNAYLPHDVAVRWAQPVSDDFHARFSALRRCYRYTLYNHPVRSPLHARYAAWCFRALDEHAMRRAAQYLIGQHDFSSFRSSECQAKTPVRTVYRIDLHRDSDFLVLEIEADAFLHHMVRNIVGALVYVGSARTSETWLHHVLTARDRTVAAPTYAPCGLSLLRVTYPAHFGLTAQ